MDKSCYKSFIKCGKVFDPELPNTLDQSQPPIVLGEVTVNTKHITMPCVLIKFSEFINFAILGLNPKLSILYRLVRKDNTLNDEQILQEWEFEFESAEITEATNLNTSQPTVLNYCDCLNNFTSDNLTYKLEIVQIETNSVRGLSIVNKSIIATVTRGINKSCLDFKKDYYIPFVECGRVFNPVLPLMLSKKNRPVILTELSIITEQCTDICVLVNFSGFITSVLKDERFNELTFRLVRTFADSTVEILRKWDFRRAFVNDTNIKEPVVYNYCECLSPKFDGSCKYTFELVEAELSQNSYYDITQKSMTAQVYNKPEYQEIWLR